MASTFSLYFSLYPGTPVVIDPLPKDAYCSHFDLSSIASLIIQQLVRLCYRTQNRAMLCYEGTLLCHITLWTSLDHRAPSCCSDGCGPGTAKSGKPINSSRFFSHWVACLFMGHWKASTVFTKAGNSNHKRRFHAVLNFAHYWLLLYGAVSIARPWFIFKFQAALSVAIGESEADKFPFFGLWCGCLCVWQCANCSRASSNLPMTYGVHLASLLRYRPDCAIMLCGL